MEAQSYPPNAGKLANASDEEKKKRLDAMVNLWQNESQRRIQRDGPAALQAVPGLSEYRYQVWLRFPEWDRSAVVAQVLALRAAAPSADHQDEPVPMLFSHWRHEPSLRTMPDWKQYLPDETVFNICVLITPGGLGEGARWAIVMPRDMVARYRPSWPKQQDWVSWTSSFDWLSIGTVCIRAMLQAL
jgi:hypothetical protein